MLVLDNSEHPDRLLHRFVQRTQASPRGEPAAERERNHGEADDAAHESKSNSAEHVECKVGAGGLECDWAASGPVYVEHG
jgi:hypothetical protein